MCAWPEANFSAPDCPPASPPPPLLLPPLPRASLALLMRLDMIAFVQVFVLYGRDSFVVGNKEGLAARWDESLFIRLRYLGLMLASRACSSDVIHVTESRELSMVRLVGGGKRFGFLETWKISDKRVAGGAAKPTAPRSRTSHKTI